MVVEHIVYAAEPRPTETIGQDLSKASYLYNTFIQALEWTYTCKTQAVIAVRYMIMRF